MDLKILHFRTLMNLVHHDQQEHVTKEMALLLLSALRDWPNNRYETIPESIAGKSLGQHWAWRAEAGTALSEMLGLAQTHDKITDFDAAVEKILLHYEQEFKRCDFIAQIQYTKQLPHKIDVEQQDKNPPFLLVFNGLNISANLYLFEGQDAYAGNPVEVKIKLHATAALKQQLMNGMHFQFLEDGTREGQGIVLHVINEVLEA